MGLFSGADKQNSSAKCDKRLKLLKLVHYDVYIDFLPGGKKFDSPKVAKMAQD